MMDLASLVSWVGWATVLYLLVTFARFVNRQFIGSSGIVAAFAKKGGWAVVTGASDGIGKAYAFELARLGFNVVLISRTAAKLEAVADEIKSKHRIETRVIAVDFERATERDFERIDNELKPLQVKVLINNVGINYEFPEFFDRATSEFGEQIDESIIKVNISTMIKMTRIVLPGMLAQKAGAIVFLSSFGGRIPTPLLSIYSATKAFADFFAKSLYGEYASRGVYTQSVTPAMVVSNMSKIRKPSLMVAAPQHIARRSLARVGADVEISPYWMHAIMIRVLESLPVGISLGQVFKTNYATRARALKKKNTPA
jgi:17beta-estradiol 17-dehydrogenase / very-long-chain 3-oxoacyl-CoA reductase